MADCGPVLDESLPKGNMPARAFAFLLVALATAACTAYHPRPLDRASVDAALAPPPRATLEREASLLRHPRIAPLRLDLSHPLSPRELAVIAVVSNPGLRAERAKVGVADAQVFDAGLLPDPQLSLSADRVTGGPGSTSAHNLGLNWDGLDALVTRPARVNSEKEARKQVRLDIAWKEWSLAGHAKLLARRVAYLESQREVAAQAAKTAGELLSVSRDELARHDVKIDEFALRSAAWLDAHDREHSLGRHLAKAREELRKDLGIPPGAPLEVSTALPQIAWPAGTAQALFEAARRERLDLLALRAGYASQESKVRAEILAQFPKVTLGVSRANDTSDVRTIGFSIGITLPVLNGNRGKIAIARATREQLFDEYVSRLHDARADIGSLVADLARLHDELEPLQREIPTLADAEARMREGVAMRDVTLVAYESVRSSLLDKRLKALSLEQSAAEDEVSLELAVGGPWSGNA